ncbi:MAG TPA: ABC transporter ATP-binding protein [Candidatus Ornithomonoglobus intestinigallinarum]|uniref:ABC transporter ATP-binding protein n=1 Tax=Candidatus Ornithomonoglobus intestinigallinarum TaxID=2840894 RepID=A0A9D1KRT1_9FIRM|nr:ABC transporter ATP-binding protein [Candidatus Ornithomonoglobus intestinigallinarum]
MRLIIKYLRPLFRRMFFGLSIKSTGTLVELAIPYILSYILKSVVLKESIPLIVAWGLLMIFCSVFACVFNIWANRLAAGVARDFSEKLRNDLFAKTVSLSAAQTDAFTVASLESRITTDTYNVHGFVNMMQRMGVRAPILLIGGIAITLIMDSYLALSMLAVLPFIFITVMLISKKGVPLYTKVQKSVDRMIGVVREDAQGIRVIKALSKEKYEHGRYDAANTALVKNEKKAGITMGLVNPVMTLLMNIGIVAVIAMSAPRAAAGVSDSETVIAFIQYFTMISTAMMSVTRIFNMYTRSSASARRIEEVLSTPEDLTVKKGPDAPLKPADDAHIEFDHVSFSYLGGHTDLSDISFKLKRGGHLGIIGATGSGKTTLIKLLMRFYDVTDGCIKINGRDIRTIPRHELYSMFGAAMQNDFVFGGTIEENIEFFRGKNGVDIYGAAKTAQAEEFITSFGDGFSHMLSPKGTNVSGGQRQRLLISRALASKPDILILDDSSSALDYKTDAALRKALKRDMGGTTVVTVAQRVSSVKDCDTIIVLEYGEMIGMGTHEQLLRTCPEYREISDSQMGGAILD